MKRYCKYDNHKVLQNSYRFKKYNLIFHQNFCFVHCDFYLWGVSDDYQDMLIGKDE